MRIGITVLAVASLVANLGTGVLAQSPSPDPPPWFGGKAETPTFTVTLPDGWIAIDRTHSVEGQLSTAVDHLAAGGARVSAEGLRAAFDRSAGMGDCLVIIDTTTLDSCGLIHGSKTSPGMIGPGPLSAEEVGAVLLASLSALPTATHAEPLEAIELATGPAVRIELTMEVPDEPHLSGPLSMYITFADDRLLMLTCSTAGERPADRWLPVAMSLEFRP